MSKVRIRPYLSPTLVLLALDWHEGKDHSDFLGFAIQRTPGFQGQTRSWLPNRLTFRPPRKYERPADHPSSTSPIQKFLWWDSRIDEKDRGKSFTYEAFPVIGTPDDKKILFSAGGSAKVTVPKPVERGIGTYFNRAVVSSQAFVKRFRGKLEGARLKAALDWLANGIEESIPGFLSRPGRVDGAIYHLTDHVWVIPALQKTPADVSLVYNKTKKDDTNDEVVEELDSRIDFHPRTKAKIMHNKFLVRREGEETTAVLMGSANFTTEGLTTQANLIHTFKSPELAGYYLERKRLLQRDLPLGKTARDSEWSAWVAVGDARVRAFFSPEEKGKRESIETIVEAVRKARSSVLFCLFMPTDAPLREACFEKGDEGKMMFGLVNTIPDRPPKKGQGSAGEARVEIYSRSRKNRDVFAHSLYAKRGHPRGFWWETASLPGKNGKWPVYIHHKFVIIDAETANPTIFSGSANMSKGSLYNNDENLLQISGSSRLGQMYLAEFLRLYEHYRARAIWDRYMKGKRDDYHLRPDARWAKRAYTSGTPEFKSRIAMAKEI